MQCRLVKLASYGRDRFSGRYVEPGERPDRCLIELTRDTDLIARGHRILPRTSFAVISTDPRRISAPGGHSLGVKVESRGAGGGRAGQIRSSSRARSTASRLRLAGSLR